MLLRQPAGDVLAAMAARGGEGQLREPGQRVREAVVQLGLWGMARFRARAPGVFDYRVTALGWAAHAWGWAAVERGGVDTRVSSRGRGAA